MRLPSRLALPLLLCLGCSSDLPDYPDTVPVAGTVKQGGHPVDGATVTFLPPEGSELKHPASATTAADGTFKLSTFFSSAAVEQGAVPGTYKVTVTKIPALDPNTKSAHGEDIVARESTGPKRSNLLPAKYADAATTPLEVNIEAGKTDGYELTIE